MSEEPQKKELEILWTPQQVAKYLGIHEVTIYRWLSKKKTFDPEKIVRFANRVRIPRSEVERVAGTVRVRLQNQTPTVVEPVQTN